jgi:hypothetical protein
MNPLLMIPSEISLFREQKFVLGFSFKELLKQFEVVVDAILASIHCSSAWASL